MTIPKSKLILCVAIAGLAAYGAESGIAAYSAKAKKVDVSQSTHREPDVTVGLLPLSQRDFGVLGATWREALAYDYTHNGPTLKRQTCAKYSRHNADGAFPAQCYMISYVTPDHEKNVIMPVINPIIGLTDINVRPAETGKGYSVSASLLWAKCAFNDVLHDCSLQAPAKLTMSGDYYERLKALIVSVRDGRPHDKASKTSQGQLSGQPPARE